MNKFFITLLIALIILAGCKDDNILPKERYITEYSPYYMFYDDAKPSTGSTTDVVKIIYDNNHNILQRIGGYIKQTSDSGYFYKFSNIVYDEVKTNQDVVTITQQILPNEEGLIIDPKERLIFYKDGRMVMKVWNNGATRDTAFYSYNEKGQICYIEKRFSNNYRTTQSELTYDDKNLTTVSSKSFYTAEPDVIYKDTLTFSGYDHSRNPLTRLIIFDECFLRSLSLNNFTRYDHVKYDSDAQLVGYVRNGWWYLKYDSNNNPTFKL